MAFRWTAARRARHGARVSLVVAFFAALLFGAPGFAATVERVEVDGDTVRIRFDEGARAAQSFVLDGPRRIAVDVDGVMPGQPVDGAGVVAAVRQGRHGTDGARVVLELERPMVIAGGRFEENGRVLSLALRDADETAFAHASMLAPASYLPFGWGERRPRYKVTQAVPPPAKAPPLPRVRGDESRPLVVIDAGHGGHDPGAINPESGLREKDVTLAIAKSIRDELLASGRVRVALTRDDDRYLLHRERFGVARRMKASLFISVHADSVASPDATGASVYTLSEVASDKEAARLAARENRADVIDGVNLDEAADVSSILIDLAQRETMNSSAGFARLLGREARPLMPVKANFHRMASLLVLKAPDMPSVLFETGYISNPNDAAFISSRDGQRRIAETVRKAVDVYFARRLAAR